MVITERLTKKQKKSLAFRIRKPRHAKQALEEEGAGSMDDQATAGSQNSDRQMSALDTQVVAKEKPRSKRKDQEDTERPDQKEKKRKRETVVETADDDEENPNSKERKTETWAEKNEAPLKPKAKSRFILFVGNLKYSTSSEAIKRHFAACDPPPTIRLLTSKSAAPSKPVNKSKGCAFLEFSHRNALQQALKLHQSDLDGRKINVELTAGGGGKSETRLAKLQKRNRGLLDQRKKQASVADISHQTQLPERSERYSATSGVGKTPTTKRTWTTDDAEDGTVHRGGVKHAKKRSKKKTTQEWGTGVNAIPLG